MSSKGNKPKTSNKKNGIPSFNNKGSKNLYGAISSAKSNMRIGHVKKG